MDSSRPLDTAELARALVLGARRELDLTPKPGLVDRKDAGSHPDLSYEAMARSIDLLPLYFDELLDGAGRDDGLRAAVDAGRAAEQRMFAAVGSNAHKGYIFLAGVTLLAARDGTTSVGQLPVAIADVARRFFAAVHPGSDRGGIRAETLAGLPAVFEVGLPSYLRRLRVSGDETTAAFELMARLMMHLEDTTAIRRCGPDGLATLRADGAALLRSIEAGDDPRALLEELNENYRKRRLTMGGVADCMALTFALSAMRKDR